MGLWYIIKCCKIPSVMKKYTLKSSTLPSVSNALICGLQGDIPPPPPPPPPQKKWPLGLAVGRALSVNKMWCPCISEESWWPHWTQISCHIRHWNGKLNSDIFRTKSLKWDLGWPYQPSHPVSVYQHLLKGGKLWNWKQMHIHTETWMRNNEGSLNIISLPNPTAENWVNQLLSAVLSSKNVVHTVLISTDFL